jgi:hypothetical protein
MRSMLFVFSAVFCLFVGVQVSAAQFKYNELMLKDYDEMLNMVNSQLKKARSNVDDQEAVSHLREAVKLILSRPDSDNMVAKLIPEVRKELIGYNAFENVLSSISAESITLVKDENSANSVQATGIFILENLIALVKPEAVNSYDLRLLLDRIRSADIEVTEGVRKDMKLRGMFKTMNPSEAAKKVLKSLPPLKEKKEPKKAPSPKDEE